MNQLQSIAEKIQQSFEVRNEKRDQTLSNARKISRACSHAIHAVHNYDNVNAEIYLIEARGLVENLRNGLVDYPEIFYSGYAQDVIKEFVEASVTFELTQNDRFPSPEELAVDDATYLNGLAEAVGELRRRILDILRRGYSQDAERLLGYMDNIYSVLTIMDFPDAITNGLRRNTDLVRGIIEKTRGDLTFSLRGEYLAQILRKVSSQLGEGEDPHLAITTNTE